MEAALNLLVWRRAQGSREYCRTPQAADEIAFQIDHVIARKHGGPSTADNLCLSCFHCNSSKGSDIATLSPRTRKLVALFNPRRQEWSRHFWWKGAYLVGRTEAGRATVVLLKINDPLRVELREGLIEEGAFPPM